jgi:hypothetical protein
LNGVMCICSMFLIEPGSNCSKSVAGPRAERI